MSLIKGNQAAKYSGIHKTLLVKVALSPKYNQRQWYEDNGPIVPSVSA